MKKIKYITTFSKNGYEVYGKTWINSFLSNVNDSNVIAEIYVDFPLQVSSDKIIIKDYDSAVPNHKDWITEFESKYNGAQYNKKMGVRFSFKSFVMMHALENNNDCYVIWLDGDCIFQSNQSYSDFVEPILNNKFVAVQREHNGGDDHCESGIVIFDTTHKDKQKFLDKFKSCYEINNIIQMGSPYDGFVVYRCAKQIDYVDLNLGYGRGGIQSDPNETFLNPELKKRFIHNIGITGKSKYGTWKVYAEKDEYFKLIRGKIRKTPQEIQNLRIQLINARNKRK